MYVDWDAGKFSSQTCLFAGKKRRERGERRREREKRERGKIKRYI